MPSLSPPLPDYTDQDVEAAARMVESENSSQPDRLKIELIWTQIRHAIEKGQSLHQRITAGSGWGPQGEKDGAGAVRPVSTRREATEHARELAREVLRGAAPSALQGARKFFEPASQDQLFARGELARAKKAKGEALNEREKHELLYQRDAAGVRKKWIGEGSKLVGVVGPVEFYT